MTTISFDIVSLVNQLSRQLLFYGDESKLLTGRHVARTFHRAPWYHFWVIKFNCKVLYLEFFDKSNTLRQRRLTTWWHSGRSGRYHAFSMLQMMMLDTRTSSRQHQISLKCVNKKQKKRISTKTKDEIFPGRWPAPEIDHQNERIHTAGRMLTT